MEQLPENWIEKIFDLLQEFYGERWASIFRNDLDIVLTKKMWFNGLNGLSYKEIKHGLAVAKKYSSNKFCNPPNLIKFYYFSKKIV